MTPPPIDPVEFYIIEHPLRGILMDQEFETPGDEWTTTWAWSKPRSEGKHFHNLGQAKTALSRLPDNVRPAAQVLFHTNRTGWHYFEDINQGEPT